MNKQMKLQFYFKVLADLRDRMHPYTWRHTGKFPNFIGIASHFHIEEKNFLHTKISDKEALKNASEFLEIDESNPIFRLRNSDGTKPKVHPECEQIEKALRLALESEEWDFDSL